MFCTPSPAAPVGNCLSLPPVSYATDKMHRSHTDIQQIHQRLAWSWRRCHGSAAASVQTSRTCGCRCQSPNDEQTSSLPRNELALFLAPGHSHHPSRTHTHTHTHTRQNYTLLNKEDAMDRSRWRKLIKDIHTYKTQMPSSILKKVHVKGI